MLIAHYIGSHTKDTLAVRTGWWFTRLVQRGSYKAVTHCEAIHTINQDGTVTIASASVRDGGVRTKHNVKLTPGNWMMVDVPQFDVQRSIDWFAFNDGLPYDWRGAIATVLPGTHSQNGYFCNEAVGASVGLKEAHIFGPAQFAAICMSLGRDVTEDFFGARQ